MEFLATTPRQFRWLADRTQVAREREDYRAGMLCTAFGNLNGFRSENCKVFEPADFFASLPRWKKGQPRIASDAENKAVVQMIIAQRKAAELRKKQA